MFKDDRLTFTYDPKKYKDKLMFFLKTAEGGRGASLAVPKLAGFLELNALDLASALSNFVTTVYIYTTYGVSAGKTLVSAVNFHPFFNPFSFTNFLQLKKNLQTNAS